jgi:hypothetical protein
LLAGLSALATPLRRFLADFNELRAARRKLVPENLPALGDWRMSVVEVLRDELTGIFYDVDVSSSSIDLFAASVVEHGMQAALVLPALKALWSREGVLPPASLQRLNLRLSPLLAGDMSVHAWHGKFYDDGLVRYATAGFYGAFLVGADGSTRRLAGGGNSLCGRSDPGIAEGMYIVDPGTTLVVGNDGFCRLVEQEIIELRNAARNPAGLQTLLRALELDRDILAVVVTRHSKLLPGHQLDDTVAQFG